MVTSTGQAVFAVVAKDAATKTLGNVGKSFGSLKRNGIRALKAIATASVVAAGAVAAFTANAVRGAISEERSILLTNAALRQRGFDLDALAPKVEAQVKAFERYGLEGENVRSGIEAGSRFFKNQNNLLKANASAANIAAVTEQDLATVMKIFGKAAQGQTRGLKTLGIEVEEGAKLKDILIAADEKYAGLADELAKSTGGKMLAAQEKFNGAMDEFGFALLPMVNDALEVLTEDILPGFQKFLEDLGPIIIGFIDNTIGPLITSFDDLAKELGFEDGFGLLLESIKVALIPLQVIAAVVKGIVDGITTAIKLLNSLSSSETSALIAGNARTQYLTGGNLGVSTPTSEMSGYLQTNVQLSIGTQKQDQLVSGALQRMAPGRRGGY